MRTFLDLVGDRTAVRRFVGSAVVAILLRAGVLLLLFPLLSALFSGFPADAWPWLGALIAAVVANWWAEQRLFAAGYGIGFDLLTGVERRIRERLEQLPPGWFDARRRAEVQRTLTTAGQELCTSFAYVVTPTVSAIGASFAVGVGLLLVDPLLGAVALAGSLVVAIALLVGGRLLRASDASFAAASNEAGSRIVEFSRSQRLLRASGRAGSAESELGTALQRQRRAAVRLLGWTVPGNLLFTVAYQLMLLAVAATTVHLFLDGALDAAEVVALLVVLVRFLEPFVTLSELAPAVELLQAALRRIRTFFDAEVLAEPSSSAARDLSAPAVELRGVRFAYPGGPDVLAGIDLVVPRGSTTAVVGPSGSGKSTLLDLVTRVADVDEGTVLVDGVDVRQLRLDDLLGGVAMVHQDVYLFDGTLRENVAAGRPGATEDELRAACAAAQLDGVVERLPDGWDSRVGEDGARLSGGERQRVSIARAILRRAPLLLLDEATSALDVLTEQGLVSTLERRADDSTVLVVAHRLSTIARADQIAFLEDGRIVECGTLDELLAAGGRFADYWRLREQAAGWSLV
ncbi:ABC transporter ATP-binding protein [Nocardioides humi]|uniref:ABC transporter ATP-binding protein n=1 Tax=Nocardioides humi TaxID=449461 RepID=A0ABN2BXY4_9ACTN|nr:ABC transporter ATP-binding protein [Nocardioides humi]